MSRIYAAINHGTRREPKWEWIPHGVSIPIPDEDTLTVLRLMLIERLKVRMFLMAKVFDGGKEIKCPLQEDEGGK